MSGNAEGSSLATQADVHSVRGELKADIQRLDKKIDRVAIELVRTQADVREIKETMATKDDVSRILNAIDAFARKSENYDRAAVLHGHALVEAQTTLKEHERRLDILESNRHT